MGGTKLTKVFQKYDGQLVPKAVLLDMLEKMLERVAYLHENLQMMHRDLHFD